MIIVRFRTTDGFPLRTFFRVEYVMETIFHTFKLPPQHHIFLVNFVALHQLQKQEK